MSNKVWEAMKVALFDLNPTENSLVLTSDSKLSDDEMTAYTLTRDFRIKNVLDAIGQTKFVGIIDSKEMNEDMVAQLINILTTKTRITTVRINDNPISCKVFYPVPRVGTKRTDGNYEYSYRQGYEDGSWITHKMQCGWGVRILDNSKTDYESPFSTIYGYPITNMGYLFRNNPTSTLNLIDWDTSNATSMRYMFAGGHATSLNLNFNTSKVTDMESMFYRSKAKSLDLSSFDTSNVTSMSGMFECIHANSLDLSSFNTSKVINMRSMFAFSHITNLDLSSLELLPITDTKHMLYGGNIENLTAKPEMDVDVYN